MLYDLNWLKKGEVFPPMSEVGRIKDYADNLALFNGEAEAVLAEYQKRIQQIINKFAEQALNTIKPGDLTTFGIDLNYFQLHTLKAGDIAAGKPPTVSICNDDDDTAAKLTTEARNILNASNINCKLLEIVYDIVRFGDSIAQIYINPKTNKFDFTVMSPSMWFPIVDKEDQKRIMCNVLAWIECDEEHNNCKLHVRAHYDGHYKQIAYELKKRTVATDVRLNSGRLISIDTHTIGNVIEPERTVQTGLKDNAILNFHNSQTSNSLYGINEFGRFVSIIAELQVRYTLQSLILDKHSAPTAYGGHSALTEDRRTGAWGFKYGGYIPVTKDEPAPGYMTWDASLQANQQHIEKLEAHLHSLTELGAVINDASFGASQGFEALETRMVNAKFKARRITSTTYSQYKKLVTILLQKNGMQVVEDDISIQWNDGMPDSALRRIEIAKRKYQSGLFDRVTVLMDDFERTQKSAEAIHERKTAESGGGFALGSFEDDSSSGDGLSDE